jgi:hypothetical protein
LDREEETKGGREGGRAKVAGGRGTWGEGKGYIYIYTYRYIYRERYIDR